MQDTSIKGNGTSRFIKGSSNFPSTWEEFRNQIMAGTLTADIGLNPAGCDIIGTALSKGNLLTDETANLIDLQTSGKTVNEAIAKVFTFADDGKKACASAVSAMGVPTASTATFDVIARNIRKIKTGSDVSGVTATAEDVRSGKIFVNKSGLQIRGSVPSRSISDIQTSQGSNQVLVPAGIYSSASTKYIYDNNLSSENIKKGVTIFGVSGSYEGKPCPKPTYITSSSITMESDSRDFIIKLPSSVSKISSMSVIFEYAGVLVFAIKNGTALEGNFNALLYFGDDVSSETSYEGTVENGRNIRLHSKTLIKHESVSAVKTLITIVE